MTHQNIDKLLPKVRLDKDEGWIAGVCAGIANTFRTDPAFIRVAAVISALFFPKLTIAAYLVAWLLLDDERVGRKR